MKFGLCSLALAMMIVATPAHAVKGCDCKGTTGGLNAATLGGHASFGGSSSTGGSSAGGTTSAGSPAPRQSGQSTGLQYFNYYVHKSVVDDYQPWPEEEMRKFQKP